MQEDGTGGTCGAYIREERSVCIVLMGKPEGTRQLGRLRCGWQDNIKTDLKRKRRGGPCA
jgi:hypothetical protein